MAGDLNGSNDVGKLACFCEQEINGLGELGLVIIVEFLE